MSAESSSQNQVVEATTSTAGPARPPGRGHRTPRLPVVLRYLMVPVLFFAVMMAAQLLWAVPGLKPWATEHPMGGFVVQLGQWLLAFTLALTLAWVLMRFVDRQPLSSLGWTFSAASVPLLLLGVALACAIMLGVNALIAPTGLARLEPAATGAPAWMLVVGGLFRAFPLQGIPEEVLFRGYLMQTLRRRPIAALVWSTAGFGVIHLFSSGGQQNLGEHFWYLALPLGLGFAAGAMLLATRSLWPAIGLHGGMHVAFLVGQFTGLGHGPWVWVPWGLGFAVVGVIALLGWSRRSAERRSEVVIDR